MRFRLSLLATVLLLLIAPASRAQLNCETIIDPAGMIHNPQIITAATRTLINQGADVHVVIVDSIQRYGTSLSDVERHYEQTCSSWVNPQTGQRKANLFVVMVAPNDRAKNMFLGSYYAGAFDVTSTYSQLSNSYFKNRQWELGVAAVLNGTTGQALSFRQRAIVAQQQRAVTQPPTQTYTYPTTPTQSADSGPSGIAIFFIVLLVLGIIGTVCYFIFRKRESDETTSTGVGSTGTDYTVSDPPYMHTPIPPTSPRSYAAAAPSHTTVINNNSGGSGDGLLTGLVVGEMLSRPSQPSTVYAPSSPVYSDPTPSYTPDPAPAVQDAPDSTWEEPAAAQPDTSFSDDSSSSSSSDDSSSSSDSSFGDSSSSDSSSDSGSSGSDSGF